MNSPDQSSDARTPVLLIHGAFAGAWTWEGAFRDSMANAGRAPIVLDLHAPGENTASFGHAITRALTNFDTPPILIAHSLGALVAQRLLGRIDISALVMLAPVPPEGMLFVTPALFTTQPALWAAFWDFMTGQNERAFAAIANVVFDEQDLHDNFKQHTSRMVFEGVGTILEAHTPLPVVPASSVGVPSLVIAGADDALISPLTSMRTALFHGSEYRAESGLGHLLHVGRGSSRVADFVVDWLERKCL